MYSRERYGALLAAVEAADDGVCVMDRQGGLLYQNAMLPRLLATESERRGLEQTIADARHAVVARSDAQSLGAMAVGCAASKHAGSRWPSITVQVRTSGSEYRVRSTSVPRGERQPGECMAVVWVRRCRPRYLTVDALRARYGLTPREVRVAALVAAGSRSREIAEALGISPHTARRHAEAVLRKLGVHSRVEVRERLKA